VVDTTDLLTLHTSPSIITLMVSFTVTRKVFSRSLSLCIGLLTPFLALAQHTEPPVTAPPRVAILSPVNRSTSPQNDVVAATMAQTIRVTLRLLDEYELVSLSLPAVPSSEEVAALGSLADEVGLDFVVAGQLTDTVDGGLRFEIVVYDHAAAALTTQEEREAESIFDTFDVADSITGEIVSVLSGRRIVFGSIAISVIPPVGSWGVFVDDEFFGINAASISGIPAGERVVRVVTGAAEGSAAELFAGTIRVDGDSTTRIAVTPDSTVSSVFTPTLLGYEANTPSAEPTIATEQEVTERDAAARRNATRAQVLRAFETGGYTDHALAAGVNPNAAFVRAASDQIARVERREFFRWFALPVQFPAAEWRIDGDAGEWPADVPGYAFFDTPQRGWVSAAYHRIAYSEDTIYVTIELEGDVDAFLAMDDPRIKANLTLGPVNDTYRLQILRRDRSRGRTSPVYLDGYFFSEDRQFREIRGSRVAWRGSTVEIAIPADYLGTREGVHIRDIEVYERIDLAFDDRFSMQGGDRTVMEAPSW
jgi:TolB-like protein